MFKNSIYNSFITLDTQDAYAITLLFNCLNCLSLYLLLLQKFVLIFFVQLLVIEIQHSDQTTIAW